MTRTLSKVGHNLFGWHLEDVIPGLQSTDVATRIEAAERLRLVSGREHQQAMDVAMMALGDPLPAVRYHAIRALVQSAFGREQRLVPLLTSTRDADAQLKRSVLTDLAGIKGPQSPFQGKGKALKAISRTWSVVGETFHSTIFQDALKAAKSSSVALQILEAAAGANLMPSLYTPWRRTIKIAPVVSPGEDELQIGPWPNRCCMCGAANPSGSEELEFSGVVGQNSLGNQITTRTARGTIRVPVCGTGQCHAEQPGVGPDGLWMHFRSPQFVAELLDLGHWHVPPPDPKPV